MTEEMAIDDVLILGAGAMGSAFCFPLADNGRNVHLVGTHLDDYLIEEARRTRVHPRTGIPYPDNVHVFRHEELGTVMRRSPGMVVVAVSSPGIGWAIQELSANLRQSVPIVLLTKGLSDGGGRLRVLTEVVHAALFDSVGIDAPVVGLGGPSIAGELAARRPTSVVIGGERSEINDLVRTTIETRYYRAATTTDAVGVEACAAYKNFYALAIGASQGWHDTYEVPANRAAMHNAAASMFARALNEMSYLVGVMGGETETVYGLAGAGDLYVTCQAGRNSRMGRLLGKGLLYSEAKTGHMSDDTVEGADLARVIGPIFERQTERGEIDRSRIPLALSTIEAVCHDKPLEIRWDQLWRFPSE